MVFFYTWGFFLHLRIFFCNYVVGDKYEVWVQCDLKCKDSIFQEQSSFAKDCRKRGGLFKCCVSTYTLNIFERSRNSLINEGLIKDKPTSWCRPTLEDLPGWPDYLPGWTFEEASAKRKDPCLPAFSDAMCTETDIETGNIKQTFINGYKKEQMVMRWSF